MADLPKWKIDLSGISSWPFAVYRRSPWWTGKAWVRLNIYQTLEEAEEFLDLIKDLPQYR